MPVMMSCAPLTLSRRPRWLRNRPLGGFRAEIYCRPSSMSDGSLNGLSPLPSTVSAVDSNRRLIEGLRADKMDMLPVERRDLAPDLRGNDTALALQPLR